MITLILGLGNPGREYRETRHNAGFLVLDTLSADLFVSFKKPLMGRYLRASGTLQGHRVSLIKPLTFMNHSGEVLPGIIKKENPSRIIVVCDNMDLPGGEIRIKRGGTAGGHKGISSVLRYIGDILLIKVYVGIGRPGIEEPRSYVLRVPRGQDGVLFHEGVRRACHAIKDLIARDIEEVMHEYNRKIL